MATPLVNTFLFFHMKCFYSLQEIQEVNSSMGNPVVTLWLYLLTFITVGFFFKKKVEGQGYVSINLKSSFHKGIHM